MELQSEKSSYYPNGVTVDGVGNLYVLEVGFNPPSTLLAPRVRKITSSGSSSSLQSRAKSRQSSRPVLSPTVEMIHIRRTDFDIWLHGSQLES